MTAIGTRMSTVGRSMTRYVSLPIVAAGAAAVHLATDFESSMSKIEGLVGVSSKQVSAWSDQILNMGQTLPQAPKELADALFFVTSAGFRGAEAMDVLTMSAKAAAAGLGETQTVADAVTSAVNSYAQSGLTAAEATDIMVAAVRTGKMPADALAGVLGGVLPVASQLGVGFDEVAAAIASATRQGLEASRAATGLRFMLMSLMKPTAETTATLRDYGLSISEVQKSLAERGLLATLTELADKFDLSTTRGREAFATIVGGARGFTAASILVGQNAEAVAGVFDDVTNAVGSTNKAFEVASQTAGFKFRQALTQLEDAAIELGNIVLPIITEDVIPAIKSAIKWFTDLSPATKELALKLLFFAAVAGPLLRVAGALFKVGGALLTFGGAMAGTKIATGLAGIGTAAGTAAGAGGIAGLGAAALAVTPWLLALAAAGIILAGALGLLPSVSDKVVGGLQEVSGDETLLGKMAVKAALQADGLRGVMNLLAGSTTKLGSGIAGDLHLIDQYGIELNDAQKFTLKQYLATGNLQGALDLLNRVVKDSVDPIAKHADAEKRAADEANIWQAKAGFAAEKTKALSEAARKGRGPTAAFAGAAQGLVGQLTDWANAAYQAWLNQVKLNTAVSNWHPPTTTWAPPGGGKQGGGKVTPRIIESLMPVTVPLVTERVGRAGPLNVNVRLERRQFARGLDAEYAGRGW
jgi:TP901 family phage tail tape measure protein